MAKVSMQLDPNAAADQTGIEIVTLLEALGAGDKLDCDAIVDGITNKVLSGVEQTKLTGIEEGAEVNPADLAALDPTANTKLAGIEESATVDQTGAEIQTAVLGLADADRKLIKTDPQSGEFTVLALQRDADGKLDIDYENVAV